MKIALCMAFTGTALHEGVSPALAMILGPVHKAANHVPKAVSDRDPLPDWVRDLNYVRVHKHCNCGAVSITNGIICALQGNILFLLRRLTHAWLQCTFPKCTHTNHVLKGRSRSKTPFIRNSKAWFERALRSQRARSGFQIRSQNHDPKRLLKHDSLLCEQALTHIISLKTIPNLFLPVFCHDSGQTNTEHNFPYMAISEAISHEEMYVHCMSKA